MYNSALEYHIAVLQGLQKVAGYTNDMFSPDEIDFHLNRQQSRLLEGMVNKKFMEAEVMVDWIRPIITKNYPLQVFIPPTTSYIYEPLMVYGVLPPRYLYLINDRSGVITSTASGTCSDLTSFKGNPVYQSNYTELVGALPMFTSLATTPPYFYNATLTITRSGLPISVSLPTGYNNIQSSKSGFYVVNWFMENFADTLYNLYSINVELFWEYYRGRYYPNSFVLVTNDAAITAIALSSQISGSNPATGGSSSVNMVSTVYKVPNYSAIPGYAREVTSNTLVELDVLYEENFNFFYSAVSVGPKTAISDRHIMAYEAKNFLISDLIIDYVRIPRTISLSLNQISELGGNAADIIVDRTIEYLKLAIENPVYRDVLQNNQIRNQV